MSRPGGPAVLVAAALIGFGGESAEARGRVALSVDLTRPVAEFAPDHALGAGIDGHQSGETARIYTPASLRAMRSAGLRPLAYRLRTELAIDAWHWNPRGSWSDPARHEGYWTSSSRAGPPIDVSYGYRLPRRGNTVDQANDDGYSRLDDGDPNTFWKSNPYLDPRMAGAAAPPQWMFLDLRRAAPVDALQIDWGTPFARHFRVEYWVGPNADFVAGGLNGRWQAFPHPGFQGDGGRQTVSVAGAPMRTRFLRIVLIDSSHTAPPGSRDLRDRLGFAVRELSVGRLVGGRLDDVVAHSPTHRQTPTYVSSTDPWHRAIDRDPGVEQPGLDLVLRSGLTNGRPVMLPVPVLYGTPSDGQAELRYLRRRHFPVGRIELGEEPDGQLSSPEDYGALYLRFARALRRVERQAVLGGPGFQTSIPTWEAWPDQHGSTSWTRRFLDVLRSHHALAELGFFSFEWYPFDNVCRAAGRQLIKAPALLAEQLRQLARDGLPGRIPKVISEYGYSSYSARAEVDLPAALLNADLVAQFLSLGGRAAYLYGYEPSPLIREPAACDSWGQLALLQSDQNRRIVHVLAAYQAARMLTQTWAQPGRRTHRLYEVTADLPTAGGGAPVTAYAVRRPDGRLAVLLINKDPARSIAVRVRLRKGVLRGAMDLFQFSRRQYRWHARGPGGYPSPDRAPAHAVLRGPVLRLPPFSLSVLRTRGRLTVA